MSSSTRFIVAESRYLGPATTSALDMCRSLDLAVQLDLRYHFSGPLCASYWIDLCQCDGYGHVRLVRAIEEALPALLDVLRDRLGPRARVGLVSLGPGDGQLDISVLEHLRQAFEVTDYCCADFSFDLLEYAVRRVCSSEAASGLPITALCTDFRGVDRLACATADVDLWLLTGYTIGNQAEPTMLADIAARMRPGDCLVLDAHLHSLDGSDMDLSPEQRRTLAQGYDTPESNRFAFGPVETVTTALAGDVTFDYCVGRFVTSVPGAVNVVTRCLGLEARMRVNSAVVSRETLDLGSTTLYAFEPVKDWLARSPLRLLTALKSGDTGVFLLEKPRSVIEGARRTAL